MGHGTKAFDETLLQERLEFFNSRNAVANAKEQSSRMTWKQSFDQLIFSIVKYTLLT